MWWPFSLPEPYDARVLSGRAVSQSQPRGNDLIRPKSYAAQASAVVEERPDESRLQSLWTSARSRKQFAIFAAGAGFVCLTSLVTRRSLTRKYLSVKPSGLFSPSNQVKDASGGVDAAEALGLATLNVCSLAVMMAGGGLWAFDISTLDDLRAKVRKSMDTELHVGKTEEEAEQDIEEWMAVTMARFSGKSEKQIQEMIKQVQQKGESKKP